MLNTVLRLIALTGFCTAVLATNVQGQSLVLQDFPGREDVRILCWAAPEKNAGYFSQIVVFQTDRLGTAKLLWQSELENAYAPQIHFIPEILTQSTRVALVERQTGAASSQLDLIGKQAGRFGRLLRIDGSQFEIKSLDGSKPPVIVAHGDVSVLDVPTIYGWNGSRFENQSRIHPSFYRELLAQDKAKLPSDASAIVLVSLSKIAELSGDRSETKAVVDEALAREQKKGREASAETLRLISERRRTLTNASHALTK